jgi:hypothetical protein
MILGAPSWLLQELMAKYGQEIEDLFKDRVEAQNMDVAYLVVGVKTCLSAQITNLNTLKSSLNAGAELPV